MKRYISVCLLFQRENSEGRKMSSLPTSFSEWKTGKDELWSCSDWPTAPSPMPPPPPSSLTPYPSSQTPCHHTISAWESVRNGACLTQHVACSQICLTEHGKCFLLLKTYRSVFDLELIKDTCPIRQLDGYFWRVIFLKHMTTLHGTRFACLYEKQLYIY